VVGGAIWQIALSIVGFLGSSAARRSRCDGPLTNFDEEDDVDVHSAGALRGADLVLALVAALQRQALIDDHASPSGRERRHSQLQRDLPVVFFERWRLRAAIVRQSSQQLGPFCRPPCHKSLWSGPASKGLDPLGGACGDLYEFFPLMMPMPEQRRASEQYGSCISTFHIVAVKISSISRIGSPRPLQFRICRIEARSSAFFVSWLVDVAEPKGGCAAQRGNRTARSTGISSILFA